MTEEWNMMALEERGTGELEEQRSGLDGSMLQQHDQTASHEEWNTGEGKERAYWQGKRRPLPRVTRKPWPKRSHSFLDPIQSTSSAASCKDRLRNIKFTEEENDILVTKVLENYPKLYGEDSSRTSSFEKKRIWRGILESINRLGVSVRNVDTCKKRFADCKRFVRAKMSKHWRHVGKRQSVRVYYTDWEEKIKAIICPLVDGIPGLIDSADPCTYECPGHWSPLENPSPEATLSPEENVTSEAFYPDTQIPANPKPQATNEEWPGFRDQTALNVKEEGGFSVLEMPAVESGRRHHENFLASEPWGPRQPETCPPPPPAMDQLLHQSQEAFRRTLRRQLHAVRQEIREFRRDHTERMDLLLTLHREHIIVEEQRNEILSQLVSTVNNLANKLSTDNSSNREHLQPLLAGTSRNRGENIHTSVDTPAQAPSRYPSRQSPEATKHPNVSRRRKHVNHGQFSNKRRK